MFLAVTELYHLENFESIDRYFVINEMSTRYLAFAFPLPTQIIYNTVKTTQHRADRLAIHASMEVWQCDRSVAITDVHFTVHDGSSLQKLEARLALEAVSQHLRSIPPQESGDAYDMAAQAADVDSRIAHE